jgi:hypothetical protein
VLAAPRLEGLRFPSGHTFELVGLNGALTAPGDLPKLNQTIDQKRRQSRLAHSFGRYARWHVDTLDGLPEHA